MNAREAYERVYPVTRIVDAYAAVAPWGGAELVDREARVPIEFDGAAVIRGLLIEGRAEADVTIRGSTRPLPFEYQDFMTGISNATPVDRVLSLAARLDEYKGVSHPALPQFLEMLTSDVGMGLGLPLWTLDQNRVRQADVVALKWALRSFVFACERYRESIGRSIQEAFGGRVAWTRPLETRATPCADTPSSIRPSARPCSLS